MTGDPSNTRRAGGFRAVATNLPKITRKALGKRGLAEGTLITEWREIVGEVLAARCLPLKLSFADPKGRTNGTLILQVESAWTLEIQHLAPQIIERINQTLGYAAVARLNFRQGPLPGAKPPTTDSRAAETWSGPPARIESSPEESGETPKTAEESDSELPGLAADIQDDRLRAILEDLGRQLANRKES